MKFMMQQSEYLIWTKFFTEDDLLGAGGGGTQIRTVNYIRIIYNKKIRIG